MAQSMSQKYKQLYKDFIYIHDKYGEVYDFCGGWCNTDRMYWLLKEPTYKKAFDTLISMLKSYFIEGYDVNGLRSTKLPIETDKKLQRIKKRWSEFM